MKEITKDYLKVFMVIAWIVTVVGSYAWAMNVAHKYDTKRRAEKQEALFSAWCKETDNPKKFTLEEFLLLKTERDFFGKRSIKY